VRGNALSAIVPSAYAKRWFLNPVSSIKDAREKKRIVVQAYHKLVEPDTDPPFIYGAESNTVEVSVITALSLCLTN
jgi:hypothetical protein